MTLLDPAFLPGSHGVAVEDATARATIGRILEDLGVLKFGTVVGEDNREAGLKEADAHGVFQKVKDFEDSGLSVVLEQKDQEETRVPEEQGEENLAADSADDSVHLDDLEIGVVAGMDEEV